MTPENFAYWLQGFFEITGSTTLTTPQVEMIKKHLGYVFEGKVGYTVTQSIPYFGVDSTKPSILTC